MSNHTKPTPIVGSINAVSILADIYAIHAIVDQHIHYMNSQNLGSYCNALGGVMTLLESLAAGVEAVDCEEVQS
ncbi:MAG: hypothetical protein BWK73_35935 [Thiothrix lacustris]|uniref:Uncharacterized protein n=1 Tax=Thiothrix lacustris TaxID=525917 RepID=A0A1Y1QFS8_9GAMM|nr:MAG: hypothetical protein BWK73_35935 [Thiothrix lacustris]